ncbi:MAG: magnesium/cobalt efflux protein [Alphaproteobacteria bacterium]|nr:magnesium/cobalt efflux protein [Alphaproteobacteria bacterium]
MPHTEPMNNAEEGPSRTQSVALTPSSTRKELFESPTSRTSRLQTAVRWLKSRVGTREEASLKEVIEEALEENAHFSGQLSEEERTLLKNVVSFGELTVIDIMVPRTDILAVERDSTMGELLTHVRDIGHTRIPVYHESLDKIEGFIHVKDLFNYIAEPNMFSIKMVMREVLFVPPSMRIVDLLLKMRMSGCHMAIVVDEYGGTDGLVTMEDLFEEIVGEIQDEHDDGEQQPLFRWVNDHVLEIDARAPIEDVEEVLGHKLRTATEEEEDYDTIGGYVFCVLGRVPAKGEVISRHDLNLKIEVFSADPRRIYKLRIVRLPKLPTQTN